jgi:glutamyl-tRNA synthetase
MHVGSARTALYNWLFARHHGGAFILRIEDTDRTRYQPDSLADLLDGLRWLGLCWDEGPEVGGAFGPYLQSDRADIYKQYAQQLVDEGRAYPCYCSPERLAAVREQQRAAGVPPGYDRHCRYLTREQFAEYEAQGIRPVIRLAIPTEGATEFDDHLRGHIVVENRQLADLVLMKSDGFPTYHLANVIDDHLMEITHIIRGDEWMSTVPEHVLIYDAFGWEMPVQAHLPLILDPSGKGKLSKRKKRLPDGREMLVYVHEFRQAGYLPEALFNFLALVGWSYDGSTEFFERPDLVRYFTLDKVSKSPSALSYDKLEHMNATYIRGLGHNDLTGRLLSVLLNAGVPADYMTVLRLTPLIRERMRTLNDVVELVDFVFTDEIHYEAEALVPKRLDRQTTRKALAAAHEALAALDAFSAEAIEARLRSLADELGIKAGDLFGAIRVACSGKAVAPPLFGTLEILGRDKALARIDQAVFALAEE